MLASVREPLLIAAHTHLAMDRQVNGWHILNPGSVGVPLDGRHLARYLLLEGDSRGWRPTFSAVPIDPAPARAEFDRPGFLESCALLGQLRREEYRPPR